MLFLTSVAALAGPTELPAEAEHQGGCQARSACSRPPVSAKAEQVGGLERSDETRLGRTVGLTLQAAAALGAPALRGLAMARGLDEAEVAEHLQLARNEGLDVAIDGRRIVVGPELREALLADLPDAVVSAWVRRSDKLFVAAHGGVTWVLPCVGVEMWGAETRLGVAADVSFLPVPGAGGLDGGGIATGTLRRHVGYGRWTGDLGLGGGALFDLSSTSPMAFVDAGLRWHAGDDGPHTVVRLGLGLGGTVVVGFEGGLYPVPLVKLTAGRQN